MHTNQLFSSRKNYPIIAIATIVTLGIFISYYLSGMFIYEFVYFSSGTVKTEMVLGGVSQLFFMFFLLLIITRNFPINFVELYSIRKPKKLHLLLAILIIVGLQLIGVSTIVVQEALIPQKYLSDYYDIVNYWDKVYDRLLSAPYLVAVIVGAAIPALSEEFLLRGFFQNSLLQRLNYKLAIFISGTVFAVLHANLVDLIALSLFGYYVGALVYYTKSIYPAIIVHFLFNLTSITTSYFNEFSWMYTLIDDLNFKESLAIFIIGNALCIVPFILIRKSKNQIPTED
jgi:sodium transport system permease protein